MGCIAISQAEGVHGGGGLRRGGSIFITCANYAVYEASRKQWTIQWSPRAKETVRSNQCKLGAYSREPFWARAGNEKRRRRPYAK